MNKIYILKNSTNDTIKIILYVICLTTLFLLYCNNEHEKIEKSIDNFHSYYNEVTLSQLKNGNKLIFIFSKLFISFILLLIFMCTVFN